MRWGIDTNASRTCVSDLGQMACLGSHVLRIGSRCLHPPKNRGTVLKLRAGAATSTCVAAAARCHLTHPRLDLGALCPVVIDHTGDSNLDFAACRTVIAHHVDRPLDCFPDN